METQNELLKSIERQTKLLTSKQITLILAFAGVYVLWGSTYFAIKILVHSVPVFLMAAARFLIAGSIMLVWGKLSNQVLPNKTQIKNAAISGFILLVLGNGTMLFANSYISSSGVIAVVVAITPLWMVLLQWLWNKGSQPTFAIWTGIALGIMGMWFLAGPENMPSLGEGSWIGILLVVAGTIFWAIGTIYSKGAIMPESSIYTSAIQMLSASACMFVFGTLFGDWQQLNFAAYGWAEGLSFVYLIIGGSVLGFTSYSYITKNAPAASVSTYAYVNPVIALFIGWWIGHELISNQTLLACALLLAGVILIVVKPKLALKIKA